MKFTTHITDVTPDGTELIRGHNLDELIKERSFAETIFLVLQGTLPSEAKKAMMEAIFTATIDHGPGTASALCARISASAKNSMHTALAAGILGLGDRHGAALEPAMQFFYDHVDHDDIPGLLAELKEKKVRIPGYGHAVIRGEDPRSVTLISLAKELGIADKYVSFAQTVYDELNKISSKHLPLNIDGAIAGILCDMGFDARLGKGIFIIGRMPGLVAQVFEEMTEDTGIRRLSQDDIEYIKE